MNCTPPLPHPPPPPQGGFQSEMTRREAAPILGLTFPTTLSIHSCVMHATLYPSACTPPPPLNNPPPPTHTHTHARTHPPPQGGFQSEMTRREAALILGLRESAAEERVKEAHRRIMIANHPDSGDCGVCVWGGGGCSSSSRGEGQGGAQAHHDR
jgi:hypothetical protein